MSGRRSSLALLVAVVVSACGTTTPTPSGPPSATTPVPVASSTPATETGGAGGTQPTATPTLAPWVAFASPRYKYTIKHPADWIVTPGNAKYADQLDDGKHFVYVSRDARPSAISVSGTVTHDVATFKRLYKAKLLTNKAITVNRWPGRLLTFTGFDAGRDVYIQHLVLGKGKVGYFVDMFSDRGAAPSDRALFKQLYTTFKPKS